MILKESDIKNILVINLESISEVILSTPTTRAIKVSYPNASLTMLTVPLTATIAEMNPFVDQVLVYDKQGEHRGITGAFEIMNIVRKRKFDLSVCLNFAVRGALIAWAAGIRHCVGYNKECAGLFLTHVVDPDRARVRHQTINHLQVLEPLGITTQDTSTVLEIDEKAEKMIALTTAFAIEQPAVAFCPMNGEHKERNLSQDQCRALIKCLASKANVYLIGGAAEREYLLALAEETGLGKSKVYGGNLDLKEVAAFLMRVQVLLSVDVGLIHIAQAMKTPVVAIFGPTDPLIYGPCGNRDVVIVHKLSCTPCLTKRNCLKNTCIVDIPVEDIVEKVLACISVTNKKE